MHNSGIINPQRACTARVTVLGQKIVSELCIGRNKQLICMASKEQDRIPKTCKSDTFEQTVHGNKYNHMRCCAEGLAL